MLVGCDDRSRGKHPDHRLSREGEASGSQHLSFSADNRAKNSSARERGEEADIGHVRVSAGASLLEDQMLDGAVGGEWKSPNRGLLRVQQKEGGDA